LAPLGYVGIQQINLLTLLGDPVLKLILPDKPDFELLPSDITINPRTPVVNQNVEIIVNLKNYGRDFPGDSVVVQLFANTSDTSYTIAEIKHHNFGEYDSILVNWIPDMGGLYTLTVKINETEIISEVDHSDNETSIVFAVFDLGEPSIIDPINGFTSTNGLINFLFIDIGYYVYRDVRYLIEIDTIIAFQNPLIQSQLIAPGKGLLEWASPLLSEGKYFWRARIIVEGDSTVWNEPRILSVHNGSASNGYSVSDKLLTSLNTYNINYSDSINGLVLNTELLPPRPSNVTFEEFIENELPQDIGGLSSITSDGTYIYFASMAYYNATQGGRSKIYKLGTGYNGTTKGQDYGFIPNVEVAIWHQMFFSPDNEGGHIYVPTGDAYSLLKVNVVSGDTSRINISDGMLNSTDGLVRNGAFFISSDGRFVYNLAYLNESGDQKYKVRTFDPFDNFSKVGEDLIPTGSSFEGFRNFFVAPGYMYPYENLYNAYLRRINLETGIFEEEWISYQPNQNLFAWTYDWINDKVYASLYNPFNPDTLSKIAIFKGTYRDASGSVTSHQVGPASEWNSLDYFIDNV